MLSLRAFGNFLNKKFKNVRFHIVVIAVKLCEFLLNLDKPHDKLITVHPANNRFPKILKPSNINKKLD